MVLNETIEFKGSYKGNQKNEIVKFSYHNDASLSFVKLIIWDEFRWVTYFVFLNIYQENKYFTNVFFCLVIWASMISSGKQFYSYIFLPRICSAFWQDWPIPGMAQMIN